MPLLPVLGLEITVAMREEAERERAASDAAAPPDPDQARFEAHWAKVSASVEAMAKTVLDRTWLAEDGDFTFALNSFGANEQRMQKARQAGRFGEADALLTQVEADLEAVKAAFPAQNEKARVAYEAKKAQQQPLLARFDGALQAHKFGQPPRPGFDEVVDLYRKARALMDQGEADKNYILAGNGLQKTQFAPRNLDVATKSIKDAWARIEKPAADLVAGAAAGAFPGLDAGALRGTEAIASAAMAAAPQNDAWDAAADAIGKLAAAVAGFRTQAAKSLLGPGAGKAKDARAKAMAFIRKDPEILKALPAQPGGKEALDAMVADLGGKAKGADDKAFVRAAIEARFGPKLGDTDLTTKYLPRLYKALGMVPDSHTLGNDKLTEINRTRVKILPEGDYDYDKDTKKGVINLQTPKTGTVDWLQSKAMAMGVDKIVGHLGGKDVSTFDALTLHEVGHAVDEDKGFMDGKVGDANYGGWRTHNVAEVAAAVGDGKAFFADFARLPRAFLQAYLEAVLRKQAVDAAGVTGKLGQGDRPDWKALKKHAAVECAENIRLKSSDSGLWDRGNGAAAKYAINGTVYQEAYDGKWVSYALAARGQILCDYQFRSPAEWFAEPYAAFFLGKLKPSHPLHAMLKADKDAGNAAQRAAR